MRIAWSTSELEKRARIKADMLHKQDLALKAKAVNYEKNAPRCESCRHYRKAATVLLGSLPQKMDARCRRHGFKVSQFGCCDTWAGADGSELAV